jgi:hypothetical protein
MQRVLRQSMVLAKRETAVAGRICVASAAALGVVEVLVFAVAFAFEFAFEFAFDCTNVRARRICG